MGLILKPSEIKSSAGQMRSRIESTRESYHGALQVVQNFSQNETLQSKAWDTVKSKIVEAHQSIVQGTLVAHEMIEQDLIILESNVGEEELDEDALVIQIQRLTQECLKYEEMIKRLLIMQGSYIFGVLPAVTKMICQYQLLLDMTKVILELMKKKLQTLYEKSNTTEALLQAVIPLLEAIQGAIKDAEMYITGKESPSENNWVLSINAIVDNLVNIKLNGILVSELDIDINTFGELYGKDTIQEIKSYMQNNFDELKANKVGGITTYILQNISGYTVSVVNGKYQFNDGKWNLLKRYTKEEIQKIVKKEQELDTIPEIVSREILINCEWDSSLLSDDMVRECNKVLYKYEINTPERISHFITQCSFESNYGRALYEKGLEEYFNQSKYGSKYRGTGYLHMTWEYSYQAFATYLILEEYPQLKNYAEYKSPAHNEEVTIEAEYNKVIKAAREEGFNITEYTKIVDLGYKYVSENFAWESAGYDWTVKNLNSIVDNGGTVDDVSSIINQWDVNTFDQREEIFNNIVKKNIFNN